jgi:hypothetical protein
MAKRPTPTTKTAATKRATPTAAERRLAAQQAMARASGAAGAARRRRLLTVFAPIGVVILIVAVLVAVKAGSHSGVKSGAAATNADSAVAKSVTSVPIAALNTVGKGSVSTPPSALTGAALTADGKPRVLFVGAEWCPFCAAERWGLAVALSRFGTLTGLGEVRSSSTDTFPNTATITFHGASYSSAYLSLTAKEIFSNQATATGNGYQPLDTLTAADSALFESVGKGSFPFIDIGGKYLISGASYDPGVLSGKTQAQIAAALSDPSSSIAKAIDGTANVITAAICRTTASAPSAVCTAPGVSAAAAELS